MKEFSKKIIFFLGAIISFVTIFVLYISYMSVSTKFSGALPFLTAMITAIWSAYGTALGFYFNKAKAENVLKIKQSVNTDRDC